MITYFFTKIIIEREGRNKANNTKTEYKTKQTLKTHTIKKKEKERNHIPQKRAEEIIS